MSKAKPKRVPPGQRASTIAPGDFIVVDESDGPHIRLVRHVIPGTGGQVAIHCWNGERTTAHMFQRDTVISIA